MIDSNNSMGTPSSTSEPLSTKDTSGAHVQPWMFATVALSVAFAGATLFIIYILCRSRKTRKKRRRDSSGFHCNHQLPFTTQCHCISTQFGRPLVNHGDLFTLNGYPRQHLPQYAARPPGTDAVACPSNGCQTCCRAERNGLESHGVVHVSNPPSYNTDGRGSFSDHPIICRDSSTSDVSRRNFLNPVYESSVHEDGEQPFADVALPELRDLFVVSPRCCTKTICDKLVVSVCHEVDHHGDTLVLDNMGISLKVPPGAVRLGEIKLIALVLNWDLSDNPNMDLKTSLVSPVVYVGPHNLKLEKPCVLKYRHCAFDSRQIRVLRSETELTERKHWTPVCDRDTPSAQCFFSQDECELIIDRFTLYTCIQEPRGDCAGKKWLQLAVFACPLRKERNHHQIRVYFLNKTNCALQWAIQNEAKFGGKLVCPEKVFLFDGNEHDMFTLTQYVSEGWEILEADNEQKIPFLHIWHGHCPHSTICYRRKPTADQSVVRRPAPIVMEINLNLLTYQETLKECSEKLYVQVFEDDLTPKTEREPVCCKHPDIDIIVNHYGVSGYVTDRTPPDSHEATSPSPPVDVLRTSNDSDRSKVKIVVNTHAQGTRNSPLVTCDEMSSKRKLPHEVRKKLMLMLDPLKGPCGTDWRDLASAFDLDGSIEYLQHKSRSPTESLLDVFEQKNMSVWQLREILRTIGRIDCSAELDSLINAETMQIRRRPMENTCTGSGIHAHARLQSEESSWTESSYLGNYSERFGHNSLSSEGLASVRNTDLCTDTYAKDFSNN